MDVSTIRKIHNQMKTQIITSAYADIPYSNTQVFPSLVDFGCGRGGDIHKVYHANYQYAFFIDVHADSLNEALQRYDENYKNKHFHAQFILHDIGSEYWFSREKVNTVMMNYVLNMLFETEHKIRTLLYSVSSILQHGGTFIGIALDGDRVRTLVEQNMIENNAFTINPLWKSSVSTHSTYGNAYEFVLKESPNTFFTDVLKGKSVREYLLDKDTFVNLAKEYGLYLVQWDHVQDTTEHAVLFLDVIFKFVKRNVSKEVHCLEFDPQVYFPIHPHIHTLVLKMTQEAFYSSSKRQGARKLSELLKRLCTHEPKTIVDGTACVGTDALTLALTFRNATVWAVEKNTHNYHALLQNSKCYMFTNIHIVHSDVVHFLRTNWYGNSIDVFYIDAPWGGKEYKKKESTDIFINDTIPIIDIFREYHTLHHFRNCVYVFKVPINFVFQHFERVLTEELHVCKSRICLFPYRCRNVNKFFFYIILPLHK